MLAELCRSLQSNLNITSKKPKHLVVRDLFQGLGCSTVVNENLRECVNSDDPSSWSSFCILMVITVVVVLLDFKTPLLWSESRILRKLRRRRQLEDPSLPRLSPHQLVAPSPYGPRPYVPHERKLDIAFAKIGKGRHTMPSRMFIPALETWWVALDVVSRIADDRDLNLSSKLTTFDPLLAFRVKILLSGLTVLGAWPKPGRRRDGIIMLLAVVAIAGLYAEMTYLVGLGFIPVPEAVRRGCLAGSMTAFALLFFVEIYAAFFGLDVANVCAHMLRRNGSVAVDSGGARRFEKFQRQIVTNSPPREFDALLYLRAVLITSYFILHLFSPRLYFWVENGVTKELCDELIIEVVLSFLDVLYAFLWIVQSAEVEPEVFRLLVTQEMKDV